jgi:hypothetical protein
LIVASVLLFVNGCDFSQKKPETALDAVGAALQSLLDAGRPADLLRTPIRTDIAPSMNVI